MTTNKQLRDLFKTELGLKPTQNIRSIMKVLNIETKEECYEVMKLMHAEALRPIEKLVQTVVMNRFDNLPIELKALIKSYVEPHVMFSYIKNKLDGFDTWDEYLEYYQKKNSRQFFRSVCPYDHSTMKHATNGSTVYIKKTG